MSLNAKRDSNQWIMTLADNVNALPAHCLNVLKLFKGLNQTLGSHKRMIG